MKVSVLVSITALLISACGGAAPPPPAAASPTVAPVKLIVGYSNITADVLPIWVDDDAGIAKKNAIDLDARLIEGGARTMAAILANEVQLGLLGGSEAVSAAVGGADDVVIATLSPVYPYLFMVPKDIKSPADLKGKKVGISSIGGSADVATRVLFKSIGLDPEKDVIFVSLGSHSARTAALISGAIQGAVDDPPQSYELEDRGFYALYDLAAKKLPAAQTGIVARKSWLDANRAVAQRFIDSIVLSIAEMRKNKQVVFDAIKKYFKIENEKTLQKTYDFYVGGVVAALPYARPEQFADSLVVLAARNEKLRGFDVSKIIDQSFVKSAEERGLHK